MKNFSYVVVIMVLSVALTVSIRGCVAERKENKKLAEAHQEALKQGLDQPTEIIKTVRDTVYKISAATTKPTQTLDPTLYVSKGYADTISKALDIAVKHINRQDRFVATLQDSIKGLLEKDEQGTRWASVKDNIFDIRYNLDSNIFYPKVTLAVDIIGHDKPGGLLKRRQYYSTIMIPDERVEISNVRQVNKITLPSRFGLDVTFGAVMTPHGLTYGVGAGLGYRIKEF